MDALTFLAKLIEFLAWPAATVSIFLLLRKEIQALLPLVRKLKAGPVEAEFEREVIQIKDGISPASQSPPVEPTAWAEKTNLARLAESDPRGAMAAAWLEVESAARTLTAAKGLDVGSEDTRSVSAAFRAISRSNLLQSSWVGRYYELRELHNRALHEPDFKVSPTASVAFIELSSRLRAQILAAR
jgi:hypothetical protein